MRSSSRTAKRSQTGLFALAALTGSLGAGRLALGGEPRKPTPPNPVLAAEDLPKVRDLLDRLGRAFLDGSAENALALFNARTDEEQDRLDGIGKALRNEFRAERYASFEVVELEADDALGGSRHSLWVRLRCAYVDRAKGAERSIRRNDLFVVEKLKHGGFALVDSPFFDTLGQKRGVNLVANVILFAIVLLAALSFWVWMGCEAFRMRPRSPFWRAAVLLVPLIGALVYFAAVYVRLWRTGAREEAAEV